jgi:hypothetical protein
MTWMPGKRARRPGGEQQPGLRPWVCGQLCSYRVLIRGLDDVQGLFTVTNRAAQNDEAVIDEPVHEGRMRGPAGLLPDRARGVPAWAVDQPHREVGHARSIRATTDMQAGDVWGATSDT